MDIKGITESVSLAVSRQQEIKGTFRFFLDGKDVVYIDGTGGANLVSNEDREAECTVCMTLEDSRLMLSGRLNVLNAYSQGKITIKGDKSIAIRLAAIL